MIHPKLNTRCAGILMHITSLPSAYGMGDFGPEAYKFADYLHSCGQRVWQILPINPPYNEEDPSPYSSIASTAGNTLLLSPELLEADGLLSKDDLENLPVTEKIDFVATHKLKKRLYDKAFQNFVNGSVADLKESYQDFCKKERSWLEGFALYVVLKAHFDKPWNEWPKEYKTRDPKALDTFAKENHASLEKIKFLQFMFLKQWTALRKYCNARDILIFGDMPIYVGQDSADVWQRPELFVVDGEGNVAGQAGVPPDYFSEDGQLWGMPVYNWEAIKSHDYDWWVQRIRKNMELYDILRLDHFRAFSTYWEVPAGEKTAKKGEWKKGPGAEFFQKLEQELGQLPLVAEDLGDIDDEVIKLRETFDMPGLKVLQFGFTKMDGWIDHIPHHYTPNFVVYTGNHDNNTTVGWFRKETDQQDHEKIKAYVGDLDISEKNIHLIMARMAYASVANMVVIPVQDLMGLDESARINKPGTVKDNWSWRLKPQQLKPQVADLLKKWVVLYDREDKTPLEKPNESNASDIRT